MFVTFRKCLLEPKLSINLAKSSTIPSINFSTQESSHRQVPKCTYILSRTQWLKNKINFQRLKMYDKDFNEKGFISGATQVNTIKKSIELPTQIVKFCTSCLHILQHN
jgi:hypothetical protein